MWIRSMVLKPEIPEEPTGPRNVHAIPPEMIVGDEYGYGG